MNMIMHLYILMQLLCYYDRPFMMVYGSYY